MNHVDQNPDPDDMREYYDEPYAFRKCSDCGASGFMELEYDNEAGEEIPINERFVWRCGSCGGGDMQADEDEIEDYQSKHPLWKI